MHREVYELVCEREDISLTLLPVVVNRTKRERERERDLDLCESIQRIKIDRSLQLYSFV